MEEIKIRKERKKEGKGRGKEESKQGSKKGKYINPDFLLHGILGGTFGCMPLCSSSTIRSLSQLTYCIMLASRPKDSDLST